LEDFREQFPTFQLEDELLLKEGRHVMYIRRLASLADSREAQGPNIRISFWFVRDRVLVC
jgi:hypothetical protein